MLQSRELLNEERQWQNDLNENTCESESQASEKGEETLETENASTIMVAPEPKKKTVEDQR